MVGTNQDAEELWTLLSEEPELGYKIAGVVGDRVATPPWQSVAECAGTDQLGELAGRVGANGVMVVASALTPADRTRAINAALAASLHVQVWPGLYGISSRRLHMTPVSGVPMFYVERREISQAQLVVKRTLDFVLAIALAVISAPLMGAAALAIKVFDRGPLIHRSERVGRDGAKITVFKFRTMVPDADRKIVDVAALNERTGGPLFKASNDPRVTRVGRLLRATSIDELPQVWNVLNGTMSMVGPRPALTNEVEHFDEELHRRHEMRPGITGLWQVEARDNPSFSAYRRLDLSYIDNWSLTLDIAILASTFHELTVRSIRALHDLWLQRRPQLGSAPATATSMTVIDLDAEHA
jgi:exopolysaccharide biosynthesis polyprenyl glycosylphosphotransferase